MLKPGVLLIYIGAGKMIYAIGRHPKREVALLIYRCRRSDTRMRISRNRLCHAQTPPRISLKYHALGRLSEHFLRLLRTFSVSLQRNILTGCKQARASYKHRLYNVFYPASSALQHTRGIAPSIRIAYPAKACHCLPKSPVLYLYILYA